MSARPSGAPDASVIPAVQAGEGLLPARVTEAQFREVRELAYRTFGLDLKQGKEALVTARLAKRVAELRLGTIGDYLEMLRGDIQAGADFPDRCIDDQLH